MAYKPSLKRMLLRCYLCTLLGLMALSVVAAILGHFTFFEPAEAQLHSSHRFHLQNPELLSALQLRDRPATDQRLLPVGHSLTAEAFTPPHSHRNAPRLPSLASRIINMRRLAQIARARVLAAIPSINPAGKAAVVGCYCYRTSPTAEFHTGVDLDANYGDVVRAAAAGTVVSAQYDGAYGLKVDIDHGNGYHTWYAHLSRADVHPGQKVVKAQSIALVGSTGRSTGPHLHYQVMLNGQAIDPEPFLKGVPPQVLAALP